MSDITSITAASELDGGAQAAQLDKARYTREEAFGLYKDAESKLADRKQKLHFFTELLRDQKEFVALKNHPAWKKLTEGAKGSIDNERMSPQDAGWPNWLAYNAGRRNMLKQFEQTVAAQCGENPQDGNAEQWTARKNELRKEISALEPLLVKSKAAYDKIVAEGGE